MESLTTEIGTYFLETFCIDGRIKIKRADACPHSHPLFFGFLLVFGAGDINDQEVILPGVLRRTI